MSRIIQHNPKQAFISALVIVTLWIVFGPIQLGGAVSYIIINGNSMEPEIEFGDLVAARKSSVYQLDQRVIYDHPQLGYVFHRIVGLEDNRFILQGDNNDWLDSYQPGQDEILGKYWFAVPGAGKVVGALKQPLYFTLFALITSSLVVGMVVSPDQTPAKRKKGKRKSMKKENISPSADFRMEALLVLFILAAAALVVSLIAFGRDTQVSVTDDLLYTQSADLTYTASAAGDIYDRSGVQTGDPIYPALSCLVDFDFSYRFSSNRLSAADRQNFTGKISLWAEIKDNDGWHRTFMLVPDYDFSGTEIHAQPSLNICRILDLIEEKESKTGLDLKVYTLSVLPRINMDGRLGGLLVEEEFQPEFAFDLSDSVLRLPYDSEGFNIDQEGKIPHQFEINNFMNILGRQVDVLAVRWASLIVLGISVLAAIYPAWSLWQDWERSSHSRIEIQHRPLMIDVKSGQIKTKGMTVIDLETMGDLRKLAERYGAMILHEVDGSIHHYLVLDEDCIYRVVIEDEEDMAKPFMKGNQDQGRDD